MAGQDPGMESVCQGKYRCLGLVAVRVGSMGATCMRANLYES